MQVFIGMWTPNDKWRAMSAPARTAYLSKVTASTRLRLGGEAESIAWGQNIDASSSDKWSFFCVWRFPNREMGAKYLSILEENDWNEYFETESIYGDPKTPFDVLTQHVTY
jgi:hypothetical protein